MCDEVFPDADARCERCGYSLHGLSSDGNCPECGKPINESNPVRRTGLPWQNGYSVGNWLRTAWGVARRPNQMFGLMHMRGTNWSARLFALFVIALAWLVGQLICGVWVMPPRHATMPVLIAASVVVMTYIETMGVVYVSWRRGWLVPWRVVERVTLYVTVGWVPAVAVWSLTYAWVYSSSFKNWLPEAWQPWLTEFEFGLLVVVAAIAMMGFETLAWLGMRQVRFANG